MKGAGETCTPYLRFTGPLLHSFSFSTIWTQAGLEPANLLLAREICFHYTTGPFIGGYYHPYNLPSPSLKGISISLQYLFTAFFVSAIYTFTCIPLTTKWSIKNCLYSHRSSWFCSILPSCIYLVLRFNHHSCFHFYKRRKWDLNPTHLSELVFSS